MGKEKTDTALETLIGDIYEAGMDAQGWPAVLQAILGHLDAHAGQLWTPTLPFPEQGGLIIEHAIDGAMYAQYQTYYHAHDVWKQQVVDRGLLYSGSSYVDAQLLPEQQWRQSEFWNDFLSEQEFYRLCGGVIDDGTQGGTPPVALACYRSPRADSFGRDELALLNRLLPHLNRSMRIRERLAETRTAAAEAALDALATGVLVLARSGRVLLANAAAGTLLTRRKELGVRLGYLRLADGEAQRRLDALLAHAAQGFRRIGNASASIALGDPTRNGLVLSVAPAGSAGSLVTSRAVAVVFLRPVPSVLPLDTPMLRAVYGLTASEAALTLALAQGQTLEEYSASRGVSIHTVRTQMRAILGKTGTERQVDLLRVLLAGAVPIRAE